MAVGAGFTIDFSEWTKYESMIRNARINTPNLQRQFLEQVGTDLITAIRGMLDSFIGPGRTRPMTGAGGPYYDSWDFQITGDTEGGSNPNMVLGQLRSVDPRLGIYWKVVEGGARAIPDVPQAALIQWAAAKFGNPLFGKAVADKIRVEGITAQAPLSRFFVFSGPPNFTPIGFTERGLVIIRRALQAYGQAFEEFLIRGRRQRILRDPTTGRFARQI